MRFSKLPAESKAAMLLTVRLSSSLSIGQIWANLGVPSDGPDGDTIPRKSYDADMKIAVWLIWRLLGQKGRAEEVIRTQAWRLRSHEAWMARARASIRMYQDIDRDRIDQVVDAAAMQTLLTVSQQLDRLNISDDRPLLDRVTDLVDCELLRRANNG